MAVNPAFVGDTPQYGMDPAAQPYGQPPAQQPYGQPPAPQPYGQPPAPQPYGQPMQNQPGYMQPQGQGYMPPIQTQPPPTGGVSWMERPQGPSGCPPGLEYLTQIDQLACVQQIEMLEMFTGWEQANKYKVVNSMGQQIYFAAEEGDMCERQCCGPSRSFTIHITDNNNQEVIRVHRDFKCCAGCCWCASADCCAHMVTVEAPPGQVAGYIRQEASGWKPEFTIRNANNEVIGSIKGPCCVCKCPGMQVDFQVWNAYGDTEIGKIAKVWTGALKEIFTDADTFSVTFPQDLDVRVKATFLGAVFLIDFMFFEENQDNSGS